MIEMDKISGRTGNRMFQIAYIYGQMIKGSVPDIYVQDPDYFEHCRDQIKQLYGEGIIPNSYVGIHVRRGDYVDNSFYVDLMKTDYYQKAMVMFPSEKFMLFSDDVEWCHKQPIFEHIPISKNDEITDLNLMAGCKGLIIANSSYSWWAGYLNEGTVVAPSSRLWYTDNICRTKVPKDWIIID